MIPLSVETESTVDAVDAKISVTNPQPLKPFRLLDFPTEIWLKIGKHAIDYAPTVTYHALRLHEQTRCSRRASVWLQQPAITRVCAPLRVELLPYYYQTRVEECCWPIQLGCVGKWLRVIGRENRQYIKAISVAPRGVDKSFQREKLQLLGRWGVEVEVENVELPSKGGMGYVDHRIRFL